MPPAGSIEAKFADERVAQLWEKSLAALEEMPDQPTLVRRAVALGRIQLAGQVPIMCSLAGELDSKEQGAYACVCLHVRDIADVLEVYRAANQWLRFATLKTVLPWQQLTPLLAEP